MGANHNPARKPITTLGSAAITSTSGLITPRSDGDKKSEVYNAANNANGTAKSSP
jgi:hypothetical protein